MSNIRKSRHFTPVVIGFILILSNIMIIIPTLLPMPWMRIADDYSNHSIYHDFHPIKEGRVWNSYGHESKLQPLLSYWAGNMKQNAEVIVALKIMMYAPAPFWIVIISAGLVWTKFKSKKGLSMFVTLSLLFSLVYGLISLSPLYKTYLLDDVSFIHPAMGPPPIETYHLPLEPFYICLLGCVCSISLPLIIGLKGIIERIHKLQILRKTT